MLYLRLIFTVFAILMAAAINPFSGAMAQTPASKTAPMVIANSTSVAYPNPSSLYVIEDPNRKMGFNSIIGFIQSGEITRYPNPNQTVNLKSNATPFWIVIPVQNASDKESWTLNLGGFGEGRTGFAHKVILYELTSRQTLMNSSSPAFVKNGSLNMASEISISLKRGVTSYLILYVEGYNGILTTFRPSLRPSGIAESKSGIFTPNAQSLFLLSSFILLTAFLFKRELLLLPLSAMWLTFFATGKLLQDYFLIDDLYGWLIPQGFRIVFPILLFISLWFSTGIRERYPPSLFVGTGILFVACGIIGMCLSSVAPTLGLALSYAPTIGISLIMSLLIWPLLSFNIRDNLNCLALIAVTVFITSVWFAVETILSIGTSETMTNICPWLLAIAAITSSLCHVLLIDKTSESAVKEEAHDPSADIIREAREASEHSRLLHVLEQERSAMRDLQIQEARQTEEMKRAKESADEANMAKSAFLAVVSHEIRTPMTGIMGMVRLLLDTGLSRDQKEYANTIQDSGEALLSLLNDILDFEKIESGKLDLEMTSFDLKRLLKGIHTLMNGHAASKNVQLVLDLDEKLPDFVIGDPTRIRQVLLNLVNNAIKFTAQGAVTIHVKDLSSVESHATAMRQIYFGVQDSGIGISAESQKKIFTPFAQADASINRKFGGTGLGLTICKRLIEAMGSSIGINSREGEGSTFFFTLPMKTATEEDKSLQSLNVLNEVAEKKLRVLVVDDNGINQKVLQGLLNKAGHQSTLASNADMAVAEVQRSEYDLILMDIELPGKSGIDACKEIRALPDKKLSHVPIVAMTGNVRQEDIQKYFSNGMNDFIGKPVMPENLQHILFKTARGDFNYPEEVVTPPPLPPQQPQPPIVEDLPPLPSMPELADDEEDIFASAVREFEKSEIVIPAQAAPPPPLPPLKPEESHLDEALIASLIKSLGAAQTEDLLKDFYDKSEELIADVKSAHAAQDQDAVRARAHELKGMAANFGFKSLAANAGNIERIIAHKEEADLRPLLESLSGLYEASRMEMNQRLKA